MIILHFTQKKHVEKLCLFQLQTITKNVLVEVKFLLTHRKAYARNCSQKPCILLH